jgi:glutaredoxin
VSYDPVRREMGQLKNKRLLFDMQGNHRASHELVFHDMQKPEGASKAKQQGVKSVPVVVIDGKLARCCVVRTSTYCVLPSPKTLKLSIS